MDLAVCFASGKLTERTVDSSTVMESRFKVWFEGELDERNWVWDFGGMKRAKTEIDGMSPKDVDGSYV